MSSRAESSPRTARPDAVSSGHGEPARAGQGDQPGLHPAPATCGLRSSPESRRSVVRTARKYRVAGSSAASVHRATDVRVRRGCSGQSPRPLRAPVRSSGPQVQDRAAGPRRALRTGRSVGRAGSGRARTGVAPAHAAPPRTRRCLLVRTTAGTPAPPGPSMAARSSASALQRPRRGVTAPMRGHADAWPASAWRPATTPPLRESAAAGPRAGRTSPAGTVSRADASPSLHRLPCTADRCARAAVGHQLGSSLNGAGARRASSEWSAQNHSKLFARSRPCRAADQLAQQ
jgi:hypothetical protein